jgi:NAD(P)-dependent dehydrogenase (short-subunit alcohol dehydrogenase family)
MARVLITGASKGIGRATARELAARGHEVVATARTPETLADLPVHARLALDVTDQASVDRAIAAAGDVDALVSNAGETLRAPLESIPLAEVERLFQLNTLGALRVAQAVLPAMRRRGAGRLLFVSSALGRVAVPLSGGYAASKWALEALAETLAIETGHFGISVTLLQPGAVSSGALDRVRTLLADDDPYLPLAEELAATGRQFITVEQMADAVADALEMDHPPLRIPVGAPAEKLLAARASARDDVPFSGAPLRW